VRLVYVVKRFPKVSETFVLREIEELIRQGEDVEVVSLVRPHAGEPVHDGAEAVLVRTTYLPEGLRRLAALAGAVATALVRAPGRAWPALGWSIEWTLRDRSLEHLRRFGEAAYMYRRLPAGADHFHAHFAHGAASVALLLGRLMRRPFSFTGHAKDIFQIVPPQLLRDKVSEARFVVAISEYTRAHLASLVAPGDRRKIVVVHNGIDSGRFRPRAHEPDGLPVILAVSRLVEKKGIETLVDACALLAERGVQFRCEVVGEGPRRERLERRIAERGLGARVALPGSARQEQVRDAFERAAVFALPCRRTRKGDQDGLPVSIVEAMKVGVPVVSTPTSGIPEVVEHGRSGLLVPADDPAALAGAIDRVLGDPVLRARLAAGGREAAAAFDLGSCVHDLRRLFRAGPPS
jgi:glycosyltransferase involved in cell wall biosynthesis